MTTAKNSVLQDEFTKRMLMSYSLKFFPFFALCSYFLYFVLLYSRPFWLKASILFVTQVVLLNILPCFSLAKLWSITHLCDIVRGHSKVDLTIKRDVMFFFRRAYLRVVIFGLIGITFCFALIIDIYHHDFLNGIEFFSFAYILPMYLCVIIYKFSSSLCLDKKSQDNATDLFELMKRMNHFSLDERRKANGCPYHAFGQKNLFLFFICYRLRFLLAFLIVYNICEIFIAKQSDMASFILLFGSMSSIFTFATSWFFFRNRRLI